MQRRLQHLDNDAVSQLMQQHRDLGKQSWASNSTGGLPAGGCCAVHDGL
jgi:hypothetical protein